MVTNADLPVIRSYYTSFHLYSHTVRRSVRSDGKRYRASELVALSFEPDAGVIKDAGLEEVSPA